MGIPTTTRRPAEQLRREQLAAAYGTPRRAPAPQRADSAEIDPESLRSLVGPGVRFSKRVIDVVGAAAGLIVLAPIFLLISAALLLFKQPPIFVHYRLGRDGAPFPCLKFRTMYSDAEDRLLRLLASDNEAKNEWTATQKLRADPRVTPIGHVLRRTNLDELPQLINVLAGHMSLVGPRPIVAAERVRYGPAFPAVSSVRPGLTGLWQVSGRHSLSYERRVELDIDYVTSCSMPSDLRLIARTLGHTIRAILGSQSSGGI